MLLYDRDYKFCLQMHGEYQFDLIKTIWKENIKPITYTSNWNNIPINNQLIVQYVFMWKKHGV